MGQFPTADDNLGFAAELTPIPIAVSLWIETPFPSDPIMKRHHADFAEKRELLTGIFYRSAGGPVINTKHRDQSGCASQPKAISRA